MATTMVEFLSDSSNAENCRNFAASEPCARGRRGIGSAAIYKDPNLYRLRPQSPWTLLELNMGGLCFAAIA